MATNDPKTTKPTEYDGRKPLFTPLLMIMQSRKGVATIVAIIVLLIAPVLGIDPDTAHGIAAILVVFIAGQGMADSGATVDKIEASLKRQIQDYLNK